MKGKGPLECEAIQGPSMRHRTGSYAVFTLVQKGTSLLSSQRSDQKANSVLQNFQFPRGSAVKCARKQFKSFKLTHPHVVSFDHGARRKLLNKNFRQQRFDRFRALRECLKHKEVVVDVDYQRRQQVTLGIDQTISICVGRNVLSPDSRLANSLSPPIAINRHVCLSQKSQGNL